MPLSVVKDASKAKLVATCLICDFLRNWTAKNRFLLYPGALPGSGEIRLINGVPTYRPYSIYVVTAVLDQRFIIWMIGQIVCAI